MITEVPRFARQASRLETQGRVDVVAQVQRLSGGSIPSSLGDLHLLGLSTHGVSSAFLKVG